MDVQAVRTFQQGAVGPSFFICVSRQFNFQNHMREVERNKKLQNNKKDHQRCIALYILHNIAY